jgi:hypothetical protein
LALYLRNDIGISYRKVPRALEGMFGFSFVPGSLIAFEKVLAGLAEPLADDIAKKSALSWARAGLGSRGAPPNGWGWEVTLNPRGRPRKAKK